MQRKYLRRLEIGLFIGGIVLWGLSSEFEIIWMNTLGVALVGSALMLGGVMAMATGELALWRGRYGITRDQGLTARLFGMFLTLIGGALSAYVLASLLGLEQRIGAFLADRPGYAMLPLGVVLTALGAANLSGAWNRRGSFFGVFQSLKNWLGGGLLLCLGLSLVVVGLYEVLAPEAFDNLLESFLGPLSFSGDGL